MRKLCLLVALLPFLMFSQDNEKFLLDMSEITVKLGHDAQFVEGVKKYKKCYAENKGTDKWNTWRRVQGKGNVYIFTDVLKNWAEMDDPSDAASSACRGIIQSFVMPHIISVNSNIASFIPEYSKKPSNDYNVVWVASFEVNNSTNFMKAVKEVSSALQKTEGDNRGYWYSVMGGAAKIEDFFIAVPFNNFAGLDMERDGVWKVHEKVYGKKKTDATRAKFRASLDKSWSYIYKLVPKMSMQ